MLKEFPERCAVEFNSQHQFDVYLNYCFDNNLLRKEVHGNCKAYVIPYYGIIYSFKNNNYGFNRTAKDFNIISFSDFERLVLNKQPIIIDYSFLIKILKKYGIK